MSGMPEGRKTNGRFHDDDHQHCENERNSRPSTSQGGGGYSDRRGFNKKVTFKAKNRGDNNFRKIWDDTNDLVRDQLKSEFSNRNELPGRRSFPERNRRPRSRGKYKNLSWSLKESSTGWYSVFVPNVEDSDEVLKIIQSYITPVVFYPYNKQYFDNALRFLVDDNKVAKVLHNASYKITQRDDRKLTIKVSSYLPPHGPILFTPVSSEVKEKMVEAMATRYNPSNKTLDLSKLYACPLFTNDQLFVPLNRPAVLLAALNIAAQHTKHDLYGLSLENNHIYLGEGLKWIRRLFPELKVLNLAGNKLSDLKVLKCLSGYTIEGLNLSRNPMCNTKDKERYRRDVQKFFPMLNKLDNSEVPSRYSAIVESKFKMPINLGNSYPIPKGHNPELPNPVMTLVESFLTQYYERYDNQVSRQMVSEAYSENATFTLSSCFLPKNNKGSLSLYLPESRNFLKSKQKNQLRLRLLHRGRENIIDFLEKLPKTKHDIGSFIVDVPLATTVMVQIVLNGVFVEDFKETNCKHTCRSFCRTFCIVPVGNGWSIISDMLFITTITEDLLVETSKRFRVFKPKPVSLKRNNLNGNSNQNVTMFIEDTDEMESSPFYQQQPIFSFYQPSLVMASINRQQPLSSYHAGMQTSTPQIQHMVPAASLNLQPDFPQQSTASFSMFNATTVSTTAFTTINQLSTEVPVDSIIDTNENPDKLTMIKSFSNESGMNNEWAEKCLEENGWDYVKAASCFLDMRSNIPTVAFIHQSVYNKT
ncbi:nuclear RNA export factor 1-like [Acyrthosiphon pisum]|uniref:Nuclear RNA export factor 1 n=1 Tax=Acyrthosiphon pisum TaxID=7029 RepID=A0A8R2JRQ7_ACYPI|nr:nuclear RNA export factor 1-like [Acyrthosiphon pisum]|eukprot:XP_003248099.1 PREDICTED: nuclear RNA export factor 1-like [Acyrthosiphon pisum]